MCDIKITHLPLNNWYFTRQSLFVVDYYDWPTFLWQQCELVVFNIPTLWKRIEWIGIVSPNYIHPIRCEIIRLIRLRYTVEVSAWRRMMIVCAKIWPWSSIMWVLPLQIFQSCRVLKYRRYVNLHRSFLTSRYTKRTIP